MENTENAKRSKFVYGFFGVLALLMIVWIVFSAVKGQEWATMQQGETQQYLLRVADNPLEKARGLSRSEPSDLGDAVGMVFVYDEAEPRTFTMKGMEYNLDFLWIRDGRILKIDQNIPAPGPGEEPQTISSYPLEANMVIELPAGMAQRLQYLVGHQLTINLDASK